MATWRDLCERTNKPNISLLVQTPSLPPLSAVAVVEDAVRGGLEALARADGEDLTWGVDARIVATAPPVYRPGAVASVYGFRSDPPVSDDDLVGVEFVDGSSVEIPAGMLERLG